MVVVVVVVLVVDVVVDVVVVVDVDTRISTVFDQLEYMPRESLSDLILKI